MRILAFSILTLSLDFFTPAPSFRCSPERVTVRELPVLNSLEYRPSGVYRQPVAQPQPETVTL